MKYEYTSTRLSFKPTKDGGYNMLTVPDKSGQWRLAHVTTSTAFWERIVTDAPKDIFGKPTSL